MGHYRKQEISFFVTSHCNLSCSFCYMPKMNVRKEHQSIDPEFAEIGLKYFFNNNGSRKIRFFAAGEATQDIDTMVDIYQRAYRLVGDDLVVELQTNGVFDCDVANWIDKHVDILWISCDGPPHIQDAQRPMKDGSPSSHIVLDNIKRFNKHSNMQFGVRATIIAENIDKQVELVTYFNNLGVKYLCAAPTYHSSINEKIKTPPLLDFAKNFLPAHLRGLELGLFYQTHLIVNFDETVSYYCRACTPCPQLTSDGFVSCCDWASFGPQYLPGPLQELIYGYYDRDQNKIIIDRDKEARIKSRNVSNLSNTKCGKCHALQNCAGGCVGKMIVETNNMFSATPDWCKATKYLHRKMHRSQGLYPCLHS